MSPLLLLAIGVAGGVGAGLRYLVDTGVRRVVPRRFPWGILLVNISGSFALGAVTGAVLSAELTAIIGTGFLGGYTTFSAVAVESWLLGEERRAGQAWGNLVGTALACIAAAGLGALVGRALTA
ncbi:Putative fluoride ion transporter CrcB [Microbacterium lemovicicum]|uniref:Fluoride-specific ion channel FluC n=1 Tax=Microbacterium lemovicicum TaxID=1072463 RepID=A0A3S9W6C3_9MICO|nr:CrcB family protein [Microbacterium lemovicicum]AZS35549.1 Putative fluoride ion transporter CrcB [Microbacterium lemovicicum]